MQLTLSSRFLGYYLPFVILFPELFAVHWVLLVSKCNTCWLMHHRCSVWNPLFNQLIFLKCRGDNNQGSTMSRNINLKASLLTCQSSKRIYHGKHSDDLLFSLMSHKTMYYFAQVILLMYSKVYKGSMLAWIRHYFASNMELGK